MNVFASLVVLLALISTPVFAAETKAKKPIPAELAKKVVTRYVEIARLTYADTLAGAKNLRAKIDAFVAAPSEETLKVAKDAWKSSRDVYALTEAFRFYGGPIDDPKTGPEGLLNAWPIDESYIDYVKGDANAGIINHPKEYPAITKELLAGLNEKNGEKNISTGYHAIEYLLWGQDFSKKGPGERKFTDYTTAPNAARRGTYLKLLTELLEDHLTEVAAAWDANKADNYGARLEKEALDESLRKIFTGVIGLSIDELAGERMTVALEKNDQENEQDCFSDYTLSDMVSNEIGIRNVYLGVYGKTGGLGLHDLLLEIDPAAAKKAKAQVEKALANVKAVPGTFDQVIASKKNSKERKAAAAAISAFEDQARAIAHPGLEMGLVLNIQ